MPDSSIPASKKTMAGGKNYRNSTPVPFPTKFHPTFSANNAQPILPPGLTYNPPPSAPTAYETPSLFVPAVDQENRLLLQMSSQEHGEAALPPSLSKVYKKKYHLSEEQVDEIRRLRTLDPYVNTRKVLAEKFGCSQFFIGMVAPAPQDRKEEMVRRLSVIKQRWGPVRRTARYQRQKRNELIARDE